MGEPITITADDANAMRRDMLRYLLSRPMNIVVIALLGVVGIALAIIGVQARRLDLLAFGLVFVLMAALLPLAFGRQVKRASAATMPVGSALHAWVDTDGLHAEGASGASTTPLDQISTLRTTPVTVIVMRRGLKVVYWLPRRTLTEPEIDALSATN